MFFSKTVTLDDIVNNKKLIECVDLCKPLQVICKNKTIKVVLDQSEYLALKNKASGKKHTQKKIHRLSVRDRLEEVITRRLESNKTNEVRWKDLRHFVQRDDAIRTKRKFFTAVQTYLYNKYLILPEGNDKYGVIRKKEHVGICSEVEGVYVDDKELNFESIPELADEDNIEEADLSEFID